MAIIFPKTFPSSGFHCPACKERLYSLDTATTAENMNSNICFVCYRYINVKNKIEEFSKNTDNLFTYHDLFVVNGFSISIFKEKVSNGKISEIDLEKYGIKEDSKIIQIIATPIGSLFPTIAQGNNWQLDLSQTTKLNVIGFSHGNSPHTKIDENIVQFYIFYYDEDGLSPFESQFLEALENFYNKKYKKMVIPAVCCIELRIKLFMKTAGIQREKGIKDKNLLRFVIESTSKKTKIAEIKKEHINNLLRLWGQRDSIAHSGKLIGEYGFNSASKHIVSIIFILNYINYIEHCLGIKNNTHKTGERNLFL